MMDEKAMSRAAALCSRSEHCESDIRAKLTQWQVDSASADAIVARLRADGFVDDARYARAFVHDKHLYNGWGRVKLAALLRQKGIDADTARAALAQINEEDYRATLLRLLLGKWRSVGQREPRLARAALLRFAASRGFESDLSYAAVDGIVSGSSGSDD